VEWLNKAGLGDRLQIEMKTGEICIRSASEWDVRIGKGWETFRPIGDDAEIGILKM